MFRSLPILMYHSISRFKHRLCVSPELFEDQCAVLSKAGWRGISLSEAEQYFLRKQRLPKKTLLFTFDDGYLDNYVNADPILRAHGHQGVVFTVIGMIDKQETLRPAGDDASTFDFEPLPDLDKRSPIWRNTGYKVSPIIFCSWKELESMRQKGTMEVAPHSMWHSRVVSGLNFTQLYDPAKRYSFFDVAPGNVIWGMPRFKLKHALANRGYKLVPELCELVKKMVPQDRKQATEFLAMTENRQAVISAIKKLPDFARLETEEEYRARLSEEFTACRDTYIKRLGITPVSFSWPWGSYTPLAVEEAKKAGFRVFFTTQRGMNFYGQADRVCRIAVRGGSGEELLSKVRAISSVLPELPFEIYQWGKRVRMRFS